MEDTSLIVSFLQENPNSTATAIAKGALGKTKASNGLKAVLATLKDNGQIDEDTSGKYTTYTLGTPVEAAPEQTIVVGEKIHNRGYTLEKQADGTTKVTLPTGEVEIIAADEHLIVMNNQPLYVVKNAKDVVGAISEYSRQNDMVTFVVNDEDTNKEIGAEGDVEFNDTQIKFLKMSRHNKAAA